ncbi:MAG TPA: trigger factor [Chitinophagaceae bacterium]|jgi:trigger factor|nr:trigger factor [Chitinophagaceae bacterium]
MATVTRENIGLLNDKLTLSLSKEDYLPAFEKSLKDYSKKANIPGFRKGMVPAGLIKKMYGSSLFTDEVLRSIDRELVKYLETEKIDIFAQPLPDEVNLRQLDVNSPADYHFSFEIGLKPDFKLADLEKAKTTRYKVQITDEMINNEIARLQNRYGNMKDEETITTDENVLNVSFNEVDENGNNVEGGITKDNSLLVKYFVEAIRHDLIGKAKNDFIIVKLKAGFEDKEREWIIGDLGLNKADESSADKNFKILITKIGLLEKRELKEDFFNQLYPNSDVKSEADFRNKIKEEIQAHWDSQSRNQLQHQAYHELLDDTEINFPQEFLKKWVKTQGEKSKTDEEVEKEFPVFLNQLKWTLISDKIVSENNMQVTPDEIRNFAKQQLLGYMGMGALDEDQPWIKDYIEKMMKDRKYIEDAYNRIQGQKIFEWAETQLKPEEKEISVEEFTKMVEAHQHHHH